MTQMILHNTTIYRNEKINRHEEKLLFFGNKKLANTKSIIGGGATNEKTTSESGPNGQPGNTGDTVICVDGKQVAVLTID